MATIHFLNVLEGDCNIIQHDSKRVSVIDVSNAYNEDDTEEETAVKNSATRAEMRSRTQVPKNKVDYKQKHDPDNPIDYLNKLGISSIFRFIISHPDMDHLDGIQDLFSEFTILHTWDTDNNKEIDLSSFGGGYNKEDWKFYKNLRDGKYGGTKRITPLAGDEKQYWKDDDMKILCPDQNLLDSANDGGDFNDSSFAMLFTPPKRNGGQWKILFAGDTHDDSWDYILENFSDEVSNIDILFAPHHGRDSERNYDFLKTLNPTITLFGNADSKHLAYDCYPEIRITNNQAGYVILDVNPDRIEILVKNEEFAKDFCNNPKRGFGDPTYNDIHDAWPIGQINS